MTYYELQNHHGEMIGATRYMKLNLARGAAKRIAGKWSKDSNKRGSGIKVVEIESGAIYGGSKTVEWVNA
jgi:hypothetical protein